MCSVRQSPMPSGAELRACLAIERRFGIGAHFHAAVLSAQAMSARELADQFWLDHRHLAEHDIAGRAIERDDIAFLQPRARPCARC